MLRLPAAPLACCLTHEESDSLEANEPLAWEQRAKPLNHTIPDGNLETAPRDRSVANVPLYTASPPCSLHSRRLLVSRSLEVYFMDYNHTTSFLGR